MASAARFTRSALLGHIERRMLELESSHGFTSQDGWNQVDGKGEATNRLYGEYACLARLVEDIDSGSIHRGVGAEEQARIGARS